jgi:CheY-like chemotaxis protein
MRFKIRVQTQESVSLSGVAYNLQQTYTCATPFFIKGCIMFGITIFSTQPTRQQISPMLCKTEWLSRRAAGMKGKNNNGRATILIAEDDDDNRFVMRTLLELRGYSVIEASSGQEVVEVAARAQPDLILMDLRMPVLNGLAATRLIRQQERRRVPIVALSAYDPSQHRAVAMAAGCDEYAIKPIDYERLEQLIESLLTNATSRHVAKKASGELII